MMRLTEDSRDLTEEIITAQQRGHLSPEAGANLQRWLEEPQYADFRSRIAELIDAQNWAELNDAFYTIIPFGTGGRRGAMGVGPNRINRRTIAESTQGLSRYIAGFGREACARGVVVAYDTRHHSRDFAEETARVLAGNGVKAYLFDDFRPTPELSFAVRRLGAQAGVVISASHNPPGDNGYKVFWQDGAQIVSPDDARIIEEVNKVADISSMDLDEARARGLLQIIGEEVDAAFIETVCGLALTDNRAARIVYSPLHGTGMKTVPRVLERAGFSDVHIVQEQATPDPDFSTCPDRKPNPEGDRALDILMQRAQELDADVALATDPDADRVACAVLDRLPDGTTAWRKLTGNQVACLICHFTLSQMKQQGTLPDQPVVVRTIVTTAQLDPIAAEFGAEIVNHLLVGFKYIGETIRLLPPEKEFIFGAEESLGYLRGTYARDKDSAVAALTLAEMAATLKKQGRNLMDYLNQMYRTYGYYSESLRDLYLHGQEGARLREKIMSVLRESPPAEIAGHAVERVTDRLEMTETDLQTGTVRNLPATMNGLEVTRGNLLLLHLPKGRVAVRPSGTEPKIKYYVTLCTDVPEGMSDADLCELKRATDTQAQELMNAFDALARQIAGVA